MLPKKINESELAECLVENLPLRPAARSKYRGAPMTGEEIRAAFDRASKLIAARLNEVIAQITEDGEEITLVPPLAWYEYLFCALAIVLYSVWSNSVALCNIFPVLGGIAGAFIAGGCIGIGFAFSRMVRSEGIKVLIWVGALVATMLLNSAIAVCIIIA